MTRDRSADSGLLFRFCQDCFNLCLEHGDVSFHDGPYQVGVDLEVAVDKDVSHANDLHPGHLGMPGPQTLRESARGLPDELDVMNHPVLHKLILLEGRPST